MRTAALIALVAAVSFLSAATARADDSDMVRIYRPDSDSWIDVRLGIYLPMPQGFGAWRRDALWSPRGDASDDCWW